jgi:hypothetical protein
MIHPDIQIKLIDEVVGYGIFATRMIPKGAIVYVKDNLEIEITSERFQQHSVEMKTWIEKYSYIDERGIRIISWDLAKYVNHCCDSNTLSTAYGFDIAIRDIEIGEQLTCDYAMLNVEEEMELYCDKPNCRATLRPMDFEACADSWDVKVKSALKHFQAVEQPLIYLVEDEKIEAVLRYLKDPSTYKMVKGLRYKNPILA